MFIPEIIEVTKLARHLDALLQGTQLLDAKPTHQKLLLPSHFAFRRWLQESKPRIQKSRNYSKYLVWAADKGVILSHLKFTGWWIPSWQDTVAIDYFVEGDPQQEHRRQAITRVTFDTDRGPLWYLDARCLGFIQFFASKEDFLANSPHLRLGPPINTPQFTFAHFLNATRKRPIGPICDVLIDQHRYSGLGNWMRAEVLFATQQDPYQENNTIPASQLERIYVAIHEMYQRGMDNDNYTFWKVFQRVGDHDYGTVIRDDHKNRGMYYCPSVQIEHH